MADRYRIRMLDEAELQQTGALDLVWNVFWEFEAPDYSEQGIQEFKAFIAPDAVAKRMREKALFLWGCFDGDRPTGVIAARPPCHISLLFVHKEYHRRGIARSLYEAVLDFYREEGSHRECTVNSSPYAVEAYKRLGFVPTGPEQTVNGLRFTPMKHVFR